MEICIFLGIFKILKEDKKEEQLKRNINLMRFSVSNLATVGTGKLHCNQQISGVNNLTGNWFFICFCYKKCNSQRIFVIISGFLIADTSSK